MHMKLDVEILKLSLNEQQYNIKRRINKVMI